MFISKEQMDNIHDIQLDIFRNVIHVCEALGLRYFLVHGSLLGCIKSGSFMPLDDDIDIAMPRADYERLMCEGPELIDKRYFIQSSASDERYPLEFAKVRDSETTYITEVCKHLDMHHGVYIDVFPLDFVSPSLFYRKILGFAKKLLMLRIGSVFYLEHITFKRKVCSVCAKILIPSWKKAVMLNDNLNKAVKYSKYVKLTGGKPEEQCIPAEWFSASSPFSFEGIESSVPNHWHEYLTQIYGDYTTRTLLENKLHDTTKVEINACYLDLNKTYKKYRELYNNGKVERNIYG